MAATLTRTLTDAIQERRRPKAVAGEPVIEIQGALRHLTAFYERVRTLIDYQEERFIRRLAIRRILIRRILILGDRGALAEGLLTELVRAAYLENGTVPLSAAKAVDRLLTKYLVALPVISQRYRPPELLRMERRLLGIAAAEIEDFLNPAGVEYVLTEQLTAEIGGYLHPTSSQPMSTRLASEGREGDELRAVALRAFLNADAELVSWRLLGRNDHPTWKVFVAAPEKEVGRLLGELIRVEQLLRRTSIEAKARQFHRLVPPYLVLADLAYHEPDEFLDVVDDPVRRRTLIETTIRRRISHTEERIQRSMVRATIYIFLSKVVLVLPVEIAYDLAQHDRVAYFPLIVNTLIPPSLMLMASLSLHPPSPENARLLTTRIETLLKSEPLPLLDGVVRRRTVSDRSLIVFGLFYAVMYLAVFGGLIWLLQALNFTIVSSLVFFFFVSVVGFFAFRLRAAAKELAVIPEREGFFLAIFDFFALPFLRLGRWLSVTARQVNVFLFFLDFVVEAPLKLVFVVLEDWFAFLREKREELR